MRQELDSNIVKLADLDNLIKKDSFDNDVFIFDDITNVSVDDTPIRIEMPVFAVCIEGDARVELNLKEYHVDANSLITLMPEHILHGYSHSENFKGIFIAVGNQCVDELLPDIHTALPVIMSFRTSPVIKLTDDETSVFKQMHAFLWMMIRSDVGIYKKKVVNSLLQSLLYVALSVYKTRYKYTEMKRSRNEEIFFNFVTLLEQEFKEQRTVQYYADKLCITPKHLSTVVKMVSAKTAGEWIDGYVVLAAKVMLRSSSRTIQEISVELNFPNQSFFGKFFKKHVGLPPREYRNQGME